MQYLGGKARAAKYIAPFLNQQEENVYYEPFVGGAWILKDVEKPVRYASDSNQALITLYQALQEGWVPSEVVSEDTYVMYKRNQDPLDPMTAFVGIGCSYSGKWFGGYARSGDRNYALNARNSLLSKVPYIRNVQFSCMDYKEIDLPEERCLVYCDPPYANRTGYRDSFEHGAFWETMRRWSVDHKVVISEYEAPDDFACVMEIPTKLDMHSRNGKEARIERLFMKR